MKLKPIKEQVVVLIGASSGIGRQAALDFAAKGAKVVAAARDSPGLESLAAEIRDKGGDALMLIADTADSAQMRSVADAAVGRFGRIDTWVHVAGIAIYAEFEQTSPEEFRRVIDVNLNGQAYGAMAALPHLKENGGALIHITSVEARRALPYHAAYAASKFGVAGMLEALRLELRHNKIPVSVTEILPASINTPLFDKAKTKMGVKPMAIAPVYQPELVSEAILYAAENPIKEFVVGGAGKMLKITQELSPGLADRILLTIGFTGQKSQEPKSETAPNNLFETVPGHAKVHGSYPGRTVATTPFNWIEKHPGMALGLAVSAISAAAVLLLAPGKRRDLREGRDS